MSDDTSRGHAEYVARQVERLVAEAKAIPQVTQGLILRAREIANRIRSLDLQDNEAAMAFIAIDSETDHLPVGPERAQWDAKTLVEKDAEIAQYERGAREEILVAAENLVRWLESESGKNSAVARRT